MNLQPLMVRYLPYLCSVCKIKMEQGSWDEQGKPWSKRNDHWMRTRQKDSSERSTVTWWLEVGDTLLKRQSLSQFGRKNMLKSSSPNNFQCYSVDTQVGLRAVTTMPGWNCLGSSWKTCFCFVNEIRNYTEDLRIYKYIYNNRCWGTTVERREVWVPIHENRPGNWVHRDGFRRELYLWLILWS
jgi:hypothetical protein